MNILTTPLSAGSKTLSPLLHLKATFHGWLLFFISLSRNGHTPSRWAPPQMILAKESQVCINATLRRFPSALTAKCTQYVPFFERSMSSSSNSCIVLSA